MSKENKCFDINLHDPTSIFFWGLILILFILVIGNFILTLSIISFFKIGLGMESIELIPEWKTVKFYGSADFNKLIKLDGQIESFKDAPAVIESDEGAIKFNLIDRKGQIHNRFTMGSDGVEATGINLMIVRDSDTNLPFFTTTSKLKYNFEKPAKSLIANSVHAAEVSSPIDKNLGIGGRKIIIKGIEGTRIDGKEIYATTEDNIFIKSANGSIELNAHKGIHINFERMPKLVNQTYNDFQYKLCFYSGVLYTAKVTSSNYDPCKSIYGIYS